VSGTIGPASAGITPVKEADGNLFGTHVDTHVLTGGLDGLFSHEKK